MNPSSIGGLEGIFPPNRSINAAKPSSYEQLRELTTDDIVQIIQWAQKNGVNLTQEKVN